MTTQEEQNSLQVEHITPQEDSLSTIPTNFLCDREGCNKSFRSLSTLKFHQSQFHDHQKIPKKIKLNRHIEERFHCPVKDCVYYYSSFAISRYFAKLRYLKQHYLKVHSICSFPCNQCGKSFSTRSYLRAHQQYCDLDIVCSCQQSFSSILALQTHVKRMGHEAEVLSVYARRISDSKAKKTEESSMMNTSINTCIQSKGGPSCSSGTSPILPKSQPPHMVAALALSELAFAGLKRVSTVEVGVQTDPSSASRRPSRKASSPIRSRETQSLKRKQTTEMETQTQLTNLKGKIRRRGSTKKVANRSMATDTRGNQDLLPSQQEVNPGPEAEPPLSIERGEFTVSDSSYIVYERHLDPNNDQCSRGDDLVCSRAMMQDQFNSSGTQTTPSGVNLQVISSGEEECLPYDFYHRDSKDDASDSLPCQSSSSSTDGNFTRREISIQADGNDYGEVIALEEEVGEPAPGMSSSNRFGLLYEHDPLVSLNPSGRLTPPPSMLSRRPPSLSSSQIRSSSIETQTDHDVFLSTHVLQQTTEEDMVDNDIILTSTETQTEREGVAGNEGGSPSLWCTSETQTCEDFSDIEPFLCSTIHTQTTVCGDHHHHSSELFPELGHFTADTHTQTGLDDAPSLVTTHTQTPILGVGLKPNG